MKKKVFVTEEKFNLAKTLLNTGISHSLVRQATELSPSSVARVNVAETYEMYKEHRQKENHGHKAAKAIKVPDVNTAGSLTTAELIENTRETIELLKKVATKDDITNLSLEMSLLNSKLNETLETFTWVAEHAQLDTRKKAWYK